jgi:putative colanic acid biosynthesis glycosyltransferase WcaI
MRILLLTLNYFPELIGIGKYSGEMAEWLAARGHEVEVVTTPPYYPEWRVRDGFSPWIYRRERCAGVDILRCPLWVPHRPSGAKRVLNLASFGLSSAPAILWRALRFRPDAVAVIKPPIFALPSALMAARLTGAKAWVHVQDFEIDVAFEMGMLKGRRVAKWMLGLEAFLLRHFDLATAISPRMRDRLIEKGIPESRTALFPNWVDCQAIHPLTVPSRFRAELGIAPAAIVALYSGNMGEKQGLDTLVEAACAVKDDPRIVVVLSGGGAARHRLEASAAGLDNVRFLPLQPVGRLNDLLNLADVHLLPQRRNAADLVMPSKLPGMLASGRPVIAGAEFGTQIANEIKGAGLIVPPDDGAAMATALRHLADDREQRIAFGEEARRKAITHWEREQVLLRFESRLAHLSHKRR